MKERDKKKIAKEDDSGGEPVLTVFSGGYSERDFVTLIEAVREERNIELRLFFDPNKYLANDKQKVMHACASLPRCALIHNATREAYIEAMHCHDVVAVALLPAEPDAKLLSGVTTLLEAIGTGQLVLATSRRRGEWLQYLPHDQWVPASGGVDAWRAALSEMARTKHRIPRAELWRLRTLDFNIDTFVDNVLQMIWQSWRHLEC